MRILLTVFMLKVSNISKKFDDKVAINDVNFELNPGKIYGFLGPNGAGKTTTMRVMTGFLTPDTGSVSYEASDISQDTNILNSIGYLPENNPLYENMRVDEFLLFVSEVKGVDKEELKIIAIECGLTSVLTQEIGNLSKGFKQRVGLAKSLIGKPKYLILDEPSTGLDPNQKTEILELIKKNAKEKTILFSSHILSEVEAIADELIIINNGIIVAKGSVTEISKHNLTGIRFSVEVDANPSDFVKLINKNKDVVGVKKLGSGRTKFKKYNVTSTNPDFGLEIYRLSVKNKWQLKEVCAQKNTLEDLFKQLTK